MGKNCSLFSTNLLMASLVIFLFNSNKVQVSAQALCLSQFALANEACSFVRAPTAKELESDSKLPPLSEAHRSHRGNPEDTACCRRLAGIDNACVCGVMVRLPRFITKPKHVLKLSPIKGCEVSFECDGA